MNHEGKGMMYFISLGIEEESQLKGCLAVSHLSWKRMLEGGSYVFEENSWKDKLVILSECLCFMNLAVSQTQ